MEFPVPRSKAARGARRYGSLLTVIGLVVSGTACIHGPPTQQLSPAFSKERHHRVALLVARMAGERLQGLTEIGPDFDYARRTVGEVSVYVDGEDRLRESVPTYPAKPCHFAWTFNNCAFEEAYFANVTPQIVRTVEPILTAKGYAFQDLRHMARSWSRPFSEMKVREIVAAARPAADAVLILHYTDTGDRSGKGFAQKGFTFLFVRGALFDTGTGERLLAFQAPVSVLFSMAHDPDLKDRVSSSTVLEQSNTVVRISAEESIARAMSYLRDGSCADSECRTRSRGLQVHIP